MKFQGMEVVVEHWAHKMLREMLTSGGTASTVTEERQDKRPQCDWPVREKKDGVETVRQCKSEEKIYTVKGRGKWTGRERNTPICEKHILDAWKTWNVDSADPL
jgi:hypothetical protein